METERPSPAPSLQIKVCGLNEPTNLAAVAALAPDFVGFIFTENSPRHALALNADVVRALPAGPRRVGVFVNASTSEILRRQVEFRLDAVQLHGHETPQQCAELQVAGLLVIKAFGVGEAGLDFSQLGSYVPVCDYFLFDTKGAQAGGNGTTFDWTILEGYPWPTPYLLAGGLGLAHAEDLHRLQLPGLVGIDLNSSFETAPGLKDVARLQTMFDKVRNPARTASNPS